MPTIAELLLSVREFPVSHHHEPDAIWMKNVFDDVRYELTAMADSEQPLATAIYRHFAC